MSEGNTTVAVALIVKNEAHNIDLCLQSVCNWVDEIVVLDAGSSDNTTEIAKQYTDKVYVASDWRGFGKQRQRAQSYVESDFVFWLDADERVTPELKKNILGVINDHQPNCVYYINRLSNAFGKEIKHSGWHPDWICRLYKTSETHYSDSLVHEHVVVPNTHKKIYLNGVLLHNTFNYLYEYTAKTNQYIKLWSDQREGKKSSSVSKALGHALFRFIKMYFLKKGFLDGRHGFILALLSANVVFTRYADLWLRDYVKKQR
ncbi:MULTISPECIES: glycosyltransferase family 2 protein [Salinivibrio]|uniref:Glycosyltransferase n=1 Tax=Salinivibrio costicola subsp. alcaliphilus TaxID=272773 RepID=A0ABX3KV44_SALCS|nr:MULTISPECIES: glycosyltransferase family 2 protein [Salinivibrio]NUY55331.1 glycosyltransferase family 2 protein [Salinivibrio sp. EAGSL]OOE91170.1 glycosyltransferase [Salinivibrio sp. AR647]OOF35304.1 glycosyltransferase [Salinivibrio costicola subsp. alcaliphilus]